MTRPLTEEYAYLILDARYERVREAGVIRSRAVLVALGVDWEGHRHVLAVELANRESLSAWKDFLVGLKQRGLSGVHLVVTDDHEGLKSPGRSAAHGVVQRCYVHFLRNALDHVPRSADRTCLQDCAGSTTDAMPGGTHRLAAWLNALAGKAPQVLRLVEANIEETFAFYRLPPLTTAPQIHQPVERLNQEVKRRTHIVRIFTDEPCCLRLIRAWPGDPRGVDRGSRYLNMDPLREASRNPPRKEAA